MVFCGEAGVGARKRWDCQTKWPVRVRVLRQLKIFEQGSLARRIEYDGWSWVIDGSSSRVLAYYVSRRGGRMLFRWRRSAANAWTVPVTPLHGLLVYRAFIDENNQT